jgi:hypothetical protein
MANNFSIETLTTILNALKDLDQEAQTRTIQTVITALDLSIGSSDKSYRNSYNIDHREPSINVVSFSENRSISAKDFLRDKSPRTDLERVTCLAYYLTHYKDQQFFKSVDLSTLNTEAAQPKFTNISVAVDNATSAGYLVQAGKGSKQLGSIGEVYVQALPDRDAAKAAISHMKVKRKPRKANAKTAANKEKE